MKAPSEVRTALPANYGPHPTIRLLTPPTPSGAPVTPPRTPYAYPTPQHITHPGVGGTISDISALSFRPDALQRIARP